MKEGVVADYKTASVWKVKFRDFEDWRRQGLIYAWLLKQNGFPISRRRFIALLKDHSKTEASRGSDFGGSGARGVAQGAIYDTLEASLRFFKHNRLKLALRDPIDLQETACG